MTDADKQRLFFDRLAPSWREGEDLSLHRIADILSPIDLAAHKRVLDVACGSGVLDEYLKSRVPETDAIDLSAKMIEKARGNVKNAGVRYFTGDFCEHKGQYDLLLVFDAYPHFTQREKFARAAFRLLETGGELWIFFDEGRQAVNAHHHGHSADISLPLRAAKAEAAFFAGLFSPIYIEEDDKKYYIGLKKI